MSEEKEMPRYRCHKLVHALEIREIKSQDDHLRMKKHYLLVPEGEHYGAVAVTDEWMARHQPQPGGYYVVYEDGYTSYSPKQAFEGGYQLEDRYADPFDLEANLPLFVQERMVRRVYPIQADRPVSNHERMVAHVVQPHRGGYEPNTDGFNKAIEAWAHKHGISL